MEAQSASNQGGKQMRRFKQKKIPTASKYGFRTEVAVRIIVDCRALSYRVKAEVLEEEMRKRTLESTGVWG